MSFEPVFLELINLQALQQFLASIIYVYRVYHRAQSKFHETLYRYEKNTCYMQLPQFTPSSAFDENTVEIQKIFNKTNELCVFLVFHGIAP